MGKTVRVVTMLFVVACGDASTGNNAALDAGGMEVCPRPLPSTCPAAPSFGEVIEPLIERRCLVCHGPGGQAYPARDLTSYDRVYRQRTEIISQVYNCRMPPQDGVPLTADELDTLLLWLTCGAPDN